MQLEFSQIDLRYEELRSRNPSRERRLMGSLAQLGQQVPVVVVSPDASSASGGHVLIDGYKRVRLLRRLRHDTVEATSWELEEPQALFLERTLRTAEGDSALEQGWFLRELRDRFGLSLDELARRFDRTKSWVSRRLSLVADLPETVQKLVRDGAIGAHAAMKYLVPLARANGSDCEQIAKGISTLSVTTRQMATLHALYFDGSAGTREMVCTQPELVLRADAERNKPVAPTPGQELLSDLGALTAISRRAHGRVRKGAMQQLLGTECEEIAYALEHAKEDVIRILKRLDKELLRARPKRSNNDSTTS